MTALDPKNDERSSRDPNFTRQDFEFLAKLDLGTHRVIGALVVLIAVIAAVYNVLSMSGPWMLRTFLVVSAMLVVTVVRDSLARRARPLTVVLWIVWGGFIVYGLWWG